MRNVMHIRDNILDIVMMMSYRKYMTIDVEDEHGVVMKLEIKKL